MYTFLAKGAATPTRQNLSTIPEAQDAPPPPTKTNIMQYGLRSILTQKSGPFVLLSVTLSLSLALGYG